MKGGVEGLGFRSCPPHPTQSCHSCLVSPGKRPTSLPLVARGGGGTLCWGHHCPTLSTQTSVFLGETRHPFNHPLSRGMDLPESVFCLSLYGSTRISFCVTFTDFRGQLTGGRDSLTASRAKYPLLRRDTSLRASRSEPKSLFNVAQSTL